MTAVAARSRSQSIQTAPSGGWLSELEHVAGYGPNPNDLDPAAIDPDVQVEDEWFSES